MVARRRLSPEDRRAELLALGAEVFGKRPYDEVRIDEIAERAGVSRALMYHYFPDKRAFFAAVVKDEADRLYESTNKDQATGLTMFDEVRIGVMAYFAWHEQNPEAAWAAYVGLGRSDPVLLGTSDEAKNKQLEHMMARINEVVSKVPGAKLEADIERDLRVICQWLDGVHLRGVPAAHHGSHHRRRTAGRRVRALAASTRSRGCPRFPRNCPTRWRPPPSNRSSVVGTCWHHG